MHQSWHVQRRTLFFVVLVSQSSGYQSSQMASTPISGIKSLFVVVVFNWNLLRCRLLSSYTKWLLSWISTIYFEYGLHIQLVDQHCFLLGMGFTQIIQELPEANLYQLFTSPLPLSVWITHLRSQRDFFSPRRSFFFSLLFQGRGGNRAVSWPPIGSSSPLTLWYFRNVLLFSAQLQPARFQVETRQEGEWLSKREYT